MQPINTYIEQTNLKPTITQAEVEQLISEAKTFGFAGICLPPYWVKKAKRDLQDTGIQVVTVIGFPLGYQMTQAKVAELRQAIFDGADELDMVMNISAFRENPTEWVKPEIAQLAKICHEHERVLKVILETAYLSDEEIAAACRICAAAGADYVKTSTGFSPAGATEAHIRLMRATVGPNMGVKASGGIRTRAQALAMIEAGADRIGTSAGVAMVTAS